MQNGELVRIAAPSVAQGRPASSKYTKHDGTRHDHAEARNRIKPSARRIGAMGLMNALLERVDPVLHRLQLGSECLAG